RLEQKQPSHLKRDADLTRFRAIRQMFKDGIWRTTVAVNVAAIAILAFNLQSLKKESSRESHKWRAPASIETTLSEMQENPPKTTKPTRTEALLPSSL
ncbi:MAG: hypothetical protein U1E10_16835, partial [Bdellovibrionales bacterium]|nr:hypothetical protein [Bdellovibrionales bacterium]